MNLQPWTMSSLLPGFRNWPNIGRALLITATMGFTLTWILTSSSGSSQRQEQRIPLSVPLISSELTTRSVQIKTNEWNGKGHAVVKGCNITNGKSLKFYGQSSEDRALFEHYFSKPNICGGIFVEIGALDGVTYSNTKFFEDFLHWKGVLIEAQPRNAVKLRKNRPLAQNFAEAICPRGQESVEFVDGRGPAVGGVLAEMTDGHKAHWTFQKARVYKVPCRPMADILKAAGIQAVDIFILDVEGAELMVLGTMDWSIPVKVFLVEMGRGERDQKLRDLLSQHGYRKANWNIRDYCRKGGDCTDNEVFENNNYRYLD